MAVVAPLMAWGFYRRIHRNLARQKVVAWRLMLRSAVLATLFVTLLLWPAFDPLMALSLAGGMLLGAPLALLGLRHTRFEVTPQGPYFTPNRILGVAISTLLIGRLLYRLIVRYPELQAQAGPAASPAMLATGSRTPLTLALLGLVIGYFVTYCMGVLRTSRRLPPPAPI